MKITQFNRMLIAIQKGNKDTRVAMTPTAEQTRNMRRLIKESQGVDIYTIIRRM